MIEDRPKSHDLSELLATISPATGGTSVLFSTAPPGTVALLDATTSQQLWSATPASERITPDALAVVGQRIFVVTQTSLVALHLRDGSIDWQASLVADYSQSGNPVKVLADRLLVRLRDGTTQAFDLNTGRTVWTVKQPPPSTQLRAAGNVRVDIRHNDKKRRKPLEVFVSDVATGQERHVFAPRCSTHSIIPANEPRPSGPALLSEDGNDLYLFYGFNRFCIDHWDLRSGKLVWQTNRDKGFVDMSVRDLRILMDDGRIVYVGTDGVYQIRRRDGEVAKIVDREQNKLVPTYLKDNLLVLAATASWDSFECKRAKTCALWGVDLAKREVLWRYVLPKVGSFPSSSERFAGILTADALALVEDGQAGQIVFDRIDPATGVSKLHREVKPASTEMHYVGAPELSLSGGLVWFNEGGFSAIDLASGTIRYRLH